MPKFNPGTSGVPGTAVLTGATIYFFAEETINSLTLTNSSNSSELFTFIASSNATKNATNSANSADKYGTETLTLFSESMTLGPTGTPTCPSQTPSVTCSSVSFGPLTANNLSTGPSGFGGDGLDGVIKNITGGDLANYTGAGNFTLGGNTKAASSFSGGGGNINVLQNTSAEVEAEVDYTYTVPSGTPEPATMALVGGGLLGLGFLGKFRRKKNS
jgi:hypothetical protein